MQLHCQRDASLVCIFKEPITAWKVCRHGVA
jgi:hypothetical protein